MEYPVIQATLTKRYTQRALDFIERNFRRNRPFFLYLAHAMPHKPLAASEDFYTPDTPDDLYADVIRELDWSVGQILGKLKQLGLDDNTFVLFTSDNGPWYGGSTGGLRGMKSRTWEGGLRVPFIARWPGKIPAGLVNNSPAGTIDVFPTILKAAGVDVPKDRVIDGKDIWPLLTRPGAKSPHDALFAMQGSNLMTVRSGKWRLHVRSPGGVPNRGEDWVDPRGPDGVTIIAPYEQAQPSAYPGVIGGDGPKNIMLFDLETDPAEQHDVSKKFPQVVKRLNQLGILVDVSHCGYQTTMDAINISSAPVAATHSFCRKLHDHPRGDTDEQLKMLADKNGYLGIVVYPSFIAPPGRQASLDDFLDHLEHAVAIMGVDKVGIGTDYGKVVPEPLQARLREEGMRLGHLKGYTGGAGATEGYKDHREWTNFTRGLVSRGYTDDEIKGILGGNFLRILEQVVG
ncbi:hypothetical protein ES703_86957 [subsurface metagenome]